MRLSAQARAHLEDFLLLHEHFIAEGWFDFDELKFVFGEVFGRDANGPCERGVVEIARKNKPVFENKAYGVDPEKDTEVVDLLTEIRDLLADDKPPENEGKYGKECPCGSKKHRVFRENDGTHDLRETTVCGDCERVLWFDYI
jgi:hypothetical protein